MKAINIPAVATLAVAALVAATATVVLSICVVAEIGSGETADAVPHLVQALIYLVLCGVASVVTVVVARS